MKTEKITFTFQIIRELLLCIFILTSIVCLCKITNVYCEEEKIDEEKDFLEKELIRKQIISFEWDEKHREFYLSE